MLTINSENARNIRTPFEVHCALYSNDNTSLTPTLSGDVRLADSNISAMITNETATMRKLADLADGGFSVDGSAEFYDENPVGSLDKGKLGIRTNEGGTALIVINAADPITAITVNISSGAGNITANGETYRTAPLINIPVGGRHIELIVEADAGKRVEIASITPGFAITFNNENIISISAALRSDLSVDSAVWQASEIEIRAYYPNNSEMIEAVTGIGENAPITYYAGYEGDYSEVRKFYLSEQVSIDNGNVITIKGLDLSAKLREYTTNCEVYRILQNNSLSGIYYKLDTAVSQALEYGNILKREAYPPVIGQNQSINAIIWKEQSAGDTVAQIMQICHKKINGIDFYPRFIDAGIPSLAWSKPIKKWDIFEEDCANVEQGISWNINAVSTDSDEYSVEAYVVINAAQIVATIDVEAGQIYEHNFDGFSAWANVDNADVITTTPERIVWKAQSTGSCNVWSQPITTVKLRDRIESDKVGKQLTLTPYAYGYVTNGDNGALLFPDYGTIFEKSNEGGSFKFKGDPRMQPRDVFDFHLLTGEIITCTIESITITHESGGTYADLKYRKGVI